MITMKKWDQEIEAFQGQGETFRLFSSHHLSVLPLLGLGKLSCRRKTTFSTKCCMSPVSGPRTNTIQSWVKPSDVTFFLSWALWPSSSFTCTVHWKAADRNLARTYCTRLYLIKIKQNVSHKDRWEMTELLTSRSRGRCRKEAFALLSLLCASCD